MQAVQHLVNALSLGSLYAAIAIGYTMVFSVLRLVNFAHGDLMMMGAYLGYLCMSLFSLPFSVSMVISMGICGGFGVLCERLIYRKTKDSDSMMIATLDIKHNKLKLTSLMRDMYVDIPGYGGYKLNAAYSFGGIKLLYKTLAKNFGIKLDGYVEVNFDAFVNVIDELGGIEVNLTDSEALNLRQTNYIKRRKYRSVKKGKQIFNGQQALGYCRIRHGKRQPDGHYPGVYTASGKGDDYGRTERQRLTMQAILKKVKQLSPEEMIELAEVIMPNVKTDVDERDIYSYLLAVVRMGTTKIHQFSLPIEGGYTSQTIRGQSCLVPDLPSNKSALKKFLFKS